jgi:hypothetical protein
MAIEIPPEDDPIVDLEFESLVYHEGPPAAFRVTFRGVRQSGARTGTLQTFEEGDSIPDAMLATMSPEKASRLRASETRTDAASQLRSAMFVLDYPRAVVEHFVATGKLRRKVS